MTQLMCATDETFCAYYCVMLFDSIGYELHAQDLQEIKGPMGLGVYCTLDLERAYASGKEVLVAEFRPTPTKSLPSGATELLMESGDVGDEGAWRSRNYSGVLYKGTEVCLRVHCIHALYRREWSKPQADWDALGRLMTRMKSPPLSIDSETAQTDAAWAKALERLKTYADQQVASSREHLESSWLRAGLDKGSGCVIV
eukprot:TRINITY_DN4621_c0_g1_i1.p1 TRINITY_DN4621_c0_g1~~TRINITY_DN4621_c0_g1_i1.p1  ORF type:complete len:199 (-),score=40.34 TRINITY_DN4621_c0_g1_i1:61-657(-)